MKKFIGFLLITFLISCLAPSNKKENETEPYLSKTDFDTVINDKAVTLYHLKNSKGLEVYLTNYGARIVALITPDTEGNHADIALGFSNIGSYLTEKMYLGCIVGRFANRIDEAKFTLDGREYNLSKNDGENSLHGGKVGLDKVIWEGNQEANAVTFSYLSPDGEEGYPGNLKLKKTYSLNEKNELIIEYEAETDKNTVINLSNHTYLNLKGEGNKTILDHFVMINADRYTPVDDEWIPTGELALVEGTPFDFRKGKTIGQDIEQDNVQLINGGGYDHNWVLNKDTAKTLTFAGKMWEESTGRYVAFYTTEPGMQFYGGNFMDGSVTGKAGLPYEKRSALIFETQHFPDSPNKENFPSTILRPGELYQQTVIMEFGIIGKKE